MDWSLVFLGSNSNVSYVGGRQRWEEAGRGGKKKSSLCLHTCIFTSPLNCLITVSDQKDAYFCFIYSWYVFMCLVAQWCPTLCDPMDCSLPGCSVHGISQARILEWVAIPFSRGSSWPRDQTQVSCIAGGFFTFWAARAAPLFLTELLCCTPETITTIFQIQLLINYTPI